MRIKVQGFAGQNHSWAIVNQNIARTFAKLGHDVEVVSTDGLDTFPEDLKPLLVEQPSGTYDMQVSYTAMINFAKYLINGNRNRFGIWCFETDVLPSGFAKHYKDCDLMLPPSQFAKDIFMKNKVPENRLVVVPHGIEIEKFSTSGEIYNLNTKKKLKILVNIAQPHVRKNLPGMFEAIGKAFTSKDDVCVVLKVSSRKPTHNFDVPFNDLYNDFSSKYKNRPEIKIITEFIPDISKLYRACDVVFSMTHAECFYMPGLEALATQKVVVCPRFGGQLDYLTDKNSILIDGKEGPAPRSMQYWASSPYAKTFYPNIDDAVEKLRYTINNYDKLAVSCFENIDSLLSNYTWESVVKKIIGLISI